MSKIIFFTTGHVPTDEEQKQCKASKATEFKYVDSQYGIYTLETCDAVAGCYPSAYDAVKHIKKIKSKKIKA